VKLLLDTHVWLWSLLEPARLRRDVAAALSSPDNEKWLSPISVWEALLLGERGRVNLNPDPEMSPHDPADRFIAATARVHELTLVTADQRLLRRPDGYAVLRAA
jgi:PIN domain nuclease of toxin-antitoxin system